MYKSWRPYYDEFKYVDGCLVACSPSLYELVLVVSHLYDRWFLSLLHILQPFLQNFILDSLILENIFLASCYVFTVAIYRIKIQSLVCWNYQIKFEDENNYAFPGSGFSFWCYFCYIILLGPEFCCWYIVPFLCKEIIMFVKKEL